MKKIKLDSILLFILVIPFIMTYRLSYGQTPYWLFGAIFFALVGNIVLDMLTIQTKQYEKIKHILLWGIIGTVIGSAFISAIVVRHQTHPIYMIHDIILQQEAAIRFLLDGKNPYSTLYFGTFLEQWHYGENVVNPALYHFVMEPFYLLFTIPFYFFANHIFGYFDGRMPLFALFSMLLISADLLVKQHDKKRLFLSILAFHPAMLAYTLEGRSDIFMYAFAFLGFLLLHKKKYFLSAIFIAISFAIKQSIWPLFPFYFVYLFHTVSNKKELLKIMLLFSIVFFGIVVPFFLWNQKAFLDSTVYYLSGSTTHSYPISGYGFGKVLEEIGWIKDVNAYYPFIWWQLLFGVPTFVLIIRFFIRRPTVQRMLIAYGLFLFVYWYFSRYFNNSHITYISYIFLTAFFWPEENQEEMDRK